MADKHTSGHRSLTARLALWGGALLLAVLALIVAAYALSPWLIARYAATLAPRLAVDEIIVETGRPTLEGIALHRLVVRSPTLTLTGEAGDVRYTWRELLSGRLESASFARATVMLRDANSTKTDDPAPEIDAAFDALPLEQLSIEQLTLRIERIDFEGEGALSFRDRALTLSLRGLAPEVASHFAVDVRLSELGVFAVHLTDNAPGNVAELLRVDGAFGSETLALNGETRLSGYALQLVSALAGIPPGAGTLQASFETTLAWPLAQAMTWRDLTLAIPAFAVTWQADSGELALDALTGSIALGQGVIDATLGGGIRGRINDSELTVVLPADYRLGWRDEALSGNGGPRIRVVQADATISALLRSFSIRDAATTGLSFDADINALAGAARVDGRLDTRLDIDGRNGLAANGRVRFNGRAGAGSEIRPLTWASTLALDGDVLSADGSLSSGVIDAAAVLVTYNLATGAGTVRATDTLPFSKPLAASLLPDWDAGYDVDSGRIEAAIALDWQTTERIAASANLMLNNVQAHYDDYRFRGLSGRLQMTATDLTDAAAWQLAPSALRIQAVDVGVPIEDISLVATWQDGQAQVRDTRGRVLGGNVSLSPLTYTAATGSAMFNVTLTDIDLAQLLALEGDDIVGTGTLDGRLPVTLTDNAPRIAGGTMSAQPPGGFIRITPSFSGPTGQPGLDFALLALKDFNYTQLSADIAYSESGDLQLGVQLLGRNPTVEQGRPIRYNLNISENVPVLLESLRLQSQVETKIENRVRQ